MSRSLLIALAGLGVVLMALTLTMADALLEGSDEVWLGGAAFDFLERLMLIGAPVMLTFVVLRLSRLAARTDDLALGLERAALEGRAWRAQSRRFVQGLSRAIEDQFDAWGLTPAEADVAGLLLKGATLREIAILRRTSEATTRQQAQGVYRKSGLASRAELSAYFLEDLFTLSEVQTGPSQNVEKARFDA
ncbi:helix-turn-helix transcriptional regulator [Tropicimonas marinistellae]|uniref:helix-turn-helix transcriptional regulator n=1 Tax=Tropicimonas marinistellae TaxID=1739787 RepID=UPI00082C829D|nr:hypothetical protein [Tropicimonas marinistellae]